MHSSSGTGSNARARHLDYTSTEEDDSEELMSDNYISEQVTDTSSNDSDPSVVMIDPIVAQHHLAENLHRFS